MFTQHRGRWRVGVSSAVAPFPRGSRQWLVTPCQTSPWLQLALSGRGLAVGSGMWALRAPSLRPALPGGRVGQGCAPISLSPHEAHIPSKSRAWSWGVGGCGDSVIRAELVSLAQGWGIHGGDALRVLKPQSFSAATPRAPRWSHFCSRVQWALVLLPPSFLLGWPGQSGAPVRGGLLTAPGCHGEETKFFQCSGSPGRGGVRWRLGLPVQHLPSPPGLCLSVGFQSLPSQPPSPPSPSPDSPARCRGWWQGHGGPHGRARGSGWAWDAGRRPSRPVTVCCRRRWTAASTQTRRALRPTSG